MNTGLHSFSWGRTHTSILPLIQVMSVNILWYSEKKQRISILPMGKQHLTPRHSSDTHMNTCCIDVYKHGIRRTIVKL